MTTSLYNLEILRLASSLTDAPRLEAPDGTAELRSATCGSRVTVDVALDGGLVAQFGQHVRACALGQASAALLAAHVIGAPAQTVQSAATDLRAFLAKERDDPGDWPGLEVFAPALSYPARHAAILLPFEAAALAVQRA